jgi:hypothetical protein
MRALFFSFSPLPRGPFWMCIIVGFVLAAVATLLARSGSSEFLRFDHWAIFFVSIYTLVVMFRRLRDLAPSVHFGFLIGIVSLIVVNLVYPGSPITVIASPLFLILLGAWPSAPRESSPS